MTKNEIQIIAEKAALTKGTEWATLAVAMKANKALWIKDFSKHSDGVAIKGACQAWLDAE